MQVKAFDCTHCDTISVGPFHHVWGPCCRNDACPDKWWNRAAQKTAVERVLDLVNVGIRGAA